MIAARSIRRPSATLGAYFHNYSRAINWNWTANVARVGTDRRQDERNQVRIPRSLEQELRDQFWLSRISRSINYKSTSADTCPNNPICSNFLQGTGFCSGLGLPEHGFQRRPLESRFFNDKITVNRKLTVNVGTPRSITIRRSCRHRVTPAKVPRR